MTDDFCVHRSLAAYTARYPDEKLAIDRLAPVMALGSRLFYRDCLPYHWTASAWIVDRARSQALVLNHQKLQRWIQPGGHADGDQDLRRVALREAVEETGLTTLRLDTDDIFDFDITPIPANKASPAHYHLDVRFLMWARAEEPITESLESAGARWVRLTEIGAFCGDAGITRMAARTRHTH